LAEKTGLWIGGQSVGRNHQDFQLLLKYALVAPELRNNPAFESGDMGTVLSLVDDLSLEIAMAMIDDYVVHPFSDAEDMAANIALRKGVIAAMQSICSGEMDGDYAEPAVGVPPTLGYIKNLEVLFAPDAATGKGILTKQLPFVPPEDAWTNLPDTDSWSSFIFMQKSGVPLSEALNSITPFRGECAGALQLSVLLGCLKAIGAEKLNALSASHGPAFIGAWTVSGKPGQHDVQTLARKFLTQKLDIPDNYERGSVIAVPGDYLYFSNKDDYPKQAPLGGWRGENCIYMGQDSLGGPHYSGLGLGWKTEFALRMFLGNAYMTDANGTYLDQRRSGENSDLVPAISEDPMAQVRFTMRAVMRCPDVGSGPPPEMRLLSANPAPLSDPLMRETLDLLGFQKRGPDQYVQSQILLKYLMEGLQIGDMELIQAASSDLNSAALIAALGHWTVRIEPLTPAILHLSRDDLVHVHVVRRE
jgi:hypothetical protein